MSRKYVQISMKEWGWISTALGVFVAHNENDQRAGSYLRLMKKWDQLDAGDLVKVGKPPKKRKVR